MRFSIQLSGQFQLSADGVRYTLNGKKICALLAFIAFASPERVSREELCSLFWSEHEQSAARTSLRQAIRRLKKALGDSYDDLIESSGDHFCVRSGSVWVDMKEAQQALHAGQIPTILQRNADAMLNLMNGLDFVDPSFSSWVAVTRQRLHQHAIDALSHRLRGASLSADCFSVARLLQRMEPTHEAAARYLIMHHAAEGDVSAALRIYDDLWKVLEDEYDSLPSEETQRAIVEIKQKNDVYTQRSEVAVSGLQEARATHVSKGPAPAQLIRRAPIVCVEPFEVAEHNSQRELLAVGLRSDLMGALCRFREWRVLDQERSRSAKIDLRPDAEYSVSGTLLPDEGGGQIVLSFWDQVSGEVIWSERLPFGAGRDWLTAQRRAVRRIAVALNVHLSASRLSHIGRESDVTLESHEAWLLGQALLSDWQTTSEDRAESLFRNIIDRDPAFSSAYTGLAQVLNTRHVIRPGLFRSRSIHKEALDLSLRAVSIDPLDSKAQLALAWSFALNGVWENALHTLHLACDLNENDPWSLVSASLLMAYCGACEEAIENANQMLDLGLGVSPMHWAYNAGVRFLAGDYENAELAAARSENATHYIAAWRAAALANLGRIDEARTQLSTAMHITISDWAAPGEPEEIDVINWLLHCFPIRHDRDWLRLRDGFAAAGAPVPDGRPAIGN
ncbi:MAG: BTAD domain-containing putative transcriptional regulator [Pseudomonadota bacterium]